MECKRASDVKLEMFSMPQLRDRIRANDLPDNNQDCKVTPGEQV